MTFAREKLDNKGEDYLVKMKAEIQELKVEAQTVLQNAFNNKQNVAALL